LIIIIGTDLLDLIIELKHLQEKEEERRNIGRQADYQHVSVSKKSLTVFGFPYFKDIQLYQPPANEDTLRKRANGEPDVWLDRQRVWRREEQTELRSAVKKDALRARLRKIREEKEDVNRDLHQLGLRDGEREELELRLAQIEAVEQDITNTPDHKLFEDRGQDFDWVKISFKDLETKVHSAKVRNDVMCVEQEREYGVFRIRFDAS